MWQMWQSLDQRSKQRFLVGIGIIILLATYQWYYRPLNQKLINLQKTYVTSQQDLLWMEEISKTLPSNVPLVTGDALKQLIESKWQTQNMESEIQATLKDQQVIIQSSKLNLSRFLLWLDQIQQDSGVTISEFKAENLGEGYAKIEVKLAW